MLIQVVLTRDESPKGNREGANAEQQLETQDVVSQNVQFDVHDFCNNNKIK